MIRLAQVLVISAVLSMLSAPVEADPLGTAVRWSATESWQEGNPVYTLNDDGTFHSSGGDKAKGTGFWAIEGRDFAMFWPKWDETVFRGKIMDGEIRGNAFTKEGQPVGFMVLQPVGAGDLTPASGRD